MNKVTVFILFFVCGSPGFSQSNDGNRLYEHELDEEKWEKLRDNIRYEGREGSAGRRWTYESEREWKKAQEQQGGSGNGSGSGGGQGSGQGSGYGGGDGAPQRYDDYQPPPDSPSMNVSPAGGLGFLGWILLGVLFVGLVILIYYMFINSNSKGKSITKEIEQLEDVNPTEIPLTELQRLLREALENRDYRGAVRIYFIFIIKDLAEKGWIDWEKEKTNFQYLREMSGKSEFDDFNRSVSFFEFIWYGQRDIDQNTFEQIRPNFTRFLDKLGVE